MKASGFGEIPPVPDEEGEGGTPPDVGESGGETLVAPEAELEAPHETGVTKESLQREVEALEREAKELGDPELEKEAQRLREEFERMPEGEREKIGVGFRNVGFHVEEMKNNFFAGVFNKLADVDKEKKGGVVTKFVGKLGKQFEKDAEKARERMETIEKTKNRETLANAGYLLGNTIKYGRTVLDIAGVTVAAPLRFATIGAMAFARGADAAKELRLENEKVIEKTRVGNADKAAEEAFRVYEAAKVRSDGKDVGVKDLEKAYRELLPKDILERLEAKTPEQPSLMNRVVQGFMKMHIERSVKRLEKKTEKIEGNKKLSAKEKSAKRERLFNRFDRRLHDYDRVVGQFGTVDALAMGARYAEIAGKVGAYAPTAYIALEKAFEMIGDTFSNVETSETVDRLRDGAAAALPSGYESGAAPELQGKLDAILRAEAEIPSVMEHSATPEIAADTLLKAGIPVDTLMKSGIPADSLLKAGVSLDTLIAQSEAPIDTAKVLAKAGVPVESLYKAGLTPDSLAKAGFSPDSLVKAGIPLEAVKDTTVAALGGAVEIKVEAATSSPEIGEREIAVEPKVVKPSSGVMEAQMVERVTPVTEEELRALKGMRGASEIGPEQMKLATIEKGEGVTYAIKRQLIQHAEQYGYTKESGDLDKWAVLKSKEIAIENGYIRPDGSEVRVLDLGKGKNPAYLLDRDAGGRFHVREFLGGKPSGGGKLSPYEYEWKKPDVSKAAENIESPLQKIPVKSALEAVNELPARQAVEAAASGIPDELSVRGPMDVIGTKEAAAPVLERIEVGKLPETKLPEWLTERVEYAKLAETLPEKTANLESIRDNFESYSLLVQENAVGELDAFEKQLNYLEKNVDTLGLTPSQEDFVEMSKETIDEMREMLKESQEAFKEQLADVGVSSQAYEKAIAGKGITVKELFAMEQKSELDAKKWGMFTKWVHALHPTSMEQGMKVDDFLRGIEPDNFSVKHLAVAETPVGSFVEQQSETNAFLHGLVNEYLNESKEDIPHYATALGMKPEEVERAFTELSKTKDIAGSLTKLVAEHPERAHLLSAMLEVETELKPEAQELKRTLDGLLSQKK